MELPAKVLKYDQLDRGRKRKFLIQKRLVEVIRENKELKDSIEEGWENEFEKKYENRKKTEPETKATQIKKGVDKILRRAKRLVREGYISRAARAMAQVGFLDPTEPEVLQQLREMHPGQREDLPSLPACASYTALTSNQKFVKFLKTKICKGQAPGPSGWTAEMILPPIEDPDVMELLAYFLNDFKNGLLPKELKPYLLPANLLALKKKNATKPRPVAVGELFYRIVTS